MMLAEPLKTLLYQGNIIVRFQSPQAIRGRAIGISLPHQHLQREQETKLSKGTKPVGAGISSNVSRFFYSSVPSLNRLGCKDEILTN